MYETPAPQCSVAQMVAATFSVGVKYQDESATSGIPPNIQSCVRTTDISDVGDRHHLTYFEMMGSWSIGSYWKKRAIDLAFELLTQHFAIPTEKLYATVYSGDQALGILPDTESREHWIRGVGLEEGQIVPLREENFWGPAGTFGPDPIRWTV